LVPVVDRWLLARPGAAVLALNVGGITNLTAIPPQEAASEPLIGFDCGPGNMVVDELARRRSGGAESCDRDGRLAAAGTVDAILLAELLADPALAAPPPRSLGSEQYGPRFCEALLARRPPRSEQDWCDLLATLTELTVQAVALAHRLFVAPRRMVRSVVVSGGGARNPELMRRLAAALAPLEVVSSDALGLSGDHKEAIAFALLASARIDRRPGNAPEVTGARRAVLLGKVTEC
jgi:anhydro-N-acetylmuramic acid kinase